MVFLENSFNGGMLDEFRPQLRKGKSLGTKKLNVSNWLRNEAISTYVTSSNENKCLRQRFQEKIEQMWRLKECMRGILHFAYVSKLPKVSKHRFPRVQVDGSEGIIKAATQGQVDISSESLWLAHLPSSMKTGREATEG